MGKNKLAIIGAGGHGKVVLETAQRMDAFIEIVFVDQRFGALDSVLGVPLIGNDDTLQSLVSEYCFVVAIGNNVIRREKLEMIESLGGELTSLIDPSAVVSQFATIEKGTVVFSNAVVNAEARVGKGCIVNSGAIVEHDCIVGSFTHLAPHSTMTGESQVGEMCLLGVSASLLPQVTVGDNCIIGAGTVVNKQWGSMVKLVGAPARQVN